MKDNIFEAKDVVVKFNLRGNTLTAIRGASIELYDGETLAIVGESGSGKSVFTKSFIGMLDKNGWVESGSMMMDGVDFSQYKTEKEWLQIRGKKIAMVFQDPMTSLNPTMSIGSQIMEGMIWHYRTPRRQAWMKAVELLKMVGITDAEKRMKQYPHELSGGMRQRGVIATALACNPQLLICDEPTTALDVTIQAKILELIKSLQEQMGIAVVYITHDLGVVAKVADFVNVMYAGKIIEYGTIDEIFYDPRHPYTWGLLAAMPDLGTDDERLFAIPGSPPSLQNLQPGDAFAPRNRYAMNIDYRIEPPMFKVSDTHYAATWLLHENAPKVEMPQELKRRIRRLKEEWQ